MRWVNNIFKGIGYALVQLWLVIQCALAGVAIACPCVSVFCVIFSLINGRLPRIVNEEFWKFYLLCSSPFVIFCIIYVLILLFRKK